MDRANRSREEEYGPPPYPVNPQYDGYNSYSGMSHQVGRGNIAVVSHPGQYGNAPFPGGQAAAGGSQQLGQTQIDFSDDSEDGGCFSDAAIRRGFIRKVYLTLMMQLVLTVGIILPFLYWPALREWTWTNNWFSFTMMGVVMVLILAFSCCGDLRRRVPLNFLALGLFTVAEGLMLGSVAAYFDAEAVLWAVGATALVSLSLTLFAMQSKWDFTLLSGSLWVFAWTLLSFALLCAILRSQYLNILYACLGTLLFSLFLVYDTQLILGGKHRKYEVSPEEYVFAALNLYLDIVSLFLVLLQIINICRGQ